jgi:N-carbamoylputrescine amidase
MTNLTKFNIALIQETCTKDKSANLEQAIARLREAKKAGAQIVCLQELFNFTYFCTLEEHHYFDVAETIPGPTVEKLQSVAKELSLVIIAPIFEKRAAGLYHNSAAVIDADGKLLGVYRKMHIPDDPLYLEKFYFTPGDVTGKGNGFQVFQTKYAKIGVLICWDQWYPEAARITTLMGAEILFYPTAIGWHPKEKSTFGEKQAAAWRNVQVGHAIANGVYVAAVNRVGHEQTPGTDGIEFFGRSFVADPFGEIIQEDSTQKPGILLAECDRAQIETTRRNWPFLRDRRIDAYPVITSRFID